MNAIETERLVLRDFDLDDFKAFFATTNDPEYHQFYSEHEMSREFWAEIFERILSGTHAPDRTSYQLAVCLRNGELIGTCGVRMEDMEHGQASFGCAVGRPFWGQGYALEAARRVVTLGFALLPIHRLYAETLAANTRARALAERLGMRLEGHLREQKFFRHRWWDTVIYALLEDEWRLQVGRPNP